ncbi:MAG: hypothetical protein IPM32_15455 [Ignavibacteriae bacterium]|nr:hypothetical protein [Ignavibacteriota bacterium]
MLFIILNSLIFINGLSLFFEDYDNNWIKTNAPSDQIYCIDSGVSFYIGCKEGLFKSIDITRWDSLIQKPVRSIKVIDEKIFVGLWGAQKPSTFLYSLDDGLSWTWVEGINDEVQSISINDSTILLGVGFPGNGGIFISENFGKTWNFQDLENPIYSVKVGKSKMYAGGEDGTFYEAQHSEFSKIHKFPPWKIYSIYEDEFENLIIAGFKIYLKRKNVNDWEEISSINGIDISEKYISSITGLYTIDYDKFIIKPSTFKNNCWGICEFNKTNFIISANNGLWKELKK